MEDINSLSNDGILELYNKTKKEIDSLYTDIKDTEEALKDRYIDYLTKKEFENDIRYDNFQINSLNATLNQIKECALNRGIELEPKVKKKHFKY